MKKSVFNQMPTELKSTHQLPELCTAGTAGSAMGDVITASETLDLKGLAMDEDPITAERPLSDLVRLCTTFEQKESFD